MGGWQTITAFLEMGGYGPYVWSAYGLVLGALTLNALWAYRLAKETERRLRRLLQGARKRSPISRRP